MSQQYGISILAEPSVASGTSLVDIVFVHGLHGKGEDTWKNPESAQPWPKTLLPKAVPHARIMAFAYDADIINTGKAAGQNRIAQHAWNMLGKLNEERIDEETEKRPIIFVAHSLGGLVVKNALSLAFRSPEEHLQQILECARGIVFMGTPHCGADAAKYLSFLLGFTSVFRPTNSNIVDVLKQDSEVLALISSDFHQMLISRQKQGKPDIKIRCFVEELPMQKAGISHTVVKRESAIIPGYTPYTIHADHVDMTKFPDDDPNNPGYKSVKTEIVMWARPVTKLSNAAAGNPFAANQFPSAADAARESWTMGTKSGPINQGNNKFSKNNVTSGGGAVNMGNFIGTG